MPAIARLTDIGIGTCPGHPIPIPFSAVIVQACTTTISEGKGVANANSLLICSCGHSAVPTLFSGTVIAEGGGVHRQGDLGVNNASGTYVMTMTGVTVLAGG